MFSEHINPHLVHKWRLILTCYKALGLSDEELIVILHILNLSDGRYKFSSPELIHSYSHYSIEQINECLLGLSEKKFIKFNMGQNEHGIDLSPLFLMMFTYLQGKSFRSKQEANIIQIVEDYLQRTLKNSEKKKLLTIGGDHLNPENFGKLLQEKEPQDVKWNFNQICEFVQEMIIEAHELLTNIDWTIS